MTDTAPIRLPFFARRTRLPQLPGQPSNTTYALVNGIKPEPEKSLGYIVELLGRAQGRVLAHVSAKGHVHRVDGPIAQAPEDAPALVIAKDGGRGRGAIFRQQRNGRLERVAGYHGQLDGILFEDAEETWHAKHGLPLPAFLATMFLRFCVLERQGDRGRAPYADEPPLPLVKLDKPVELFAGFHDMPLPDAIETLLYRIDAKERPCGMERFARRELTRIDLARLRSLAAATMMNLARIERTDSFYLNFDRSALSASDITFLFSAEAALNRISRTLDMLGTGLAPLASSPSEEGCAIICMQGIHSTSCDVERMLEQSGKPNTWSNPGAIPCARGGRWDVLTRLAYLCEGIRTPIRLEYLLRFDPETREVVVDFIPPEAEYMPATTFDSESEEWCELSLDERRTMAEEVSARMVLTLAAAAFASNLVVDSCLVEERALNGASGRAFRFKRAAFLAEWASTARELDEEGLLGRHVAEKLIAQNEISPMDAAFDDQPPVRPRDDARTLPQPLRDMLLADAACELEVMEPPDEPLMQRVRELRETAQIDSGQAARELMGIIEELQASCVAAELMADHPVSTQYCDNYLGRLLLGLTQDDKTLRIHRAPDALFAAQYELTNMYAHADMPEEALAGARKLLDMASTSTTARFTAISALARLERYDEIVEVAKHGLAVTLDRDAVAYYFYRLAFAFWQLDDSTAALACYRMVPPDGEIGGTARREARELMAEMRVEKAPDRDEARAVLRKRGVPLPPTERTVDFLFDTAVLLCDNGFDFLAAHCIHEIWRIVGRDELNVLQRSLMR